MPYEPIVPEGQHLGTSRKVDGAVTGHLFENGTNDLKGHAAWNWVEDPDEPYEYETPRELTPEERELAAKIAGLILAAIVLGVVAATPHVRRWWNEKAAPSVRSAWKRVTGSRKANSQVAPVASSSGSQAMFVVSATGVEIASVESKVSMSGAEWAHRFRAMLAAGAFKEEQSRILSNARIEDGDAVLEGQSETEQLTPVQFADRIKRMLEANPSLLDEETSAELVKVFTARSNPSNGSRRPELEQ